MEDLEINAETPFTEDQKKELQQYVDVFTNAWAPIAKATNRAELAKAINAAQETMEKFEEEMPDDSLFMEDMEFEMDDKEEDEEEYEDDIDDIRKQEFSVN